MIPLPPRQGFAEVDAPDPVPPSLASSLLGALGLSGLPAAGAACPFPAIPMPLAPVDIGRDPRMVSVYAHESVLNCVAWGLFHAGALKTSVKVGQEERWCVQGWENGSRRGVGCCI